MVANAGETIFNIAFLVYLTIIGVIKSINALIPTYGGIIVCSNKTYNLFTPIYTSVIIGLNPLKKNIYINNYPRSLSYSFFKFNHYCKI